VPIWPIWHGPPGFSSGRNEWRPFLSLGKVLRGLFLTRPGLLATCQEQRAWITHRRGTEDPSPQHQQGKPWSRWFPVNSSLVQPASVDEIDGCRGRTVPLRNARKRIGVSDRSAQRLQASLSSSCFDLGAQIDTTHVNIGCCDRISSKIPNRSSARCCNHNSILRNTN